MTSQIDLTPDESVVLSLLSPGIKARFDELYQKTLPRVDLTTEKLHEMLAELQRKGALQIKPPFYVRLF